MLKKISVCICVFMSIVVIILLIKLSPIFAFIYGGLNAKDGPMPSDSLWYCRELQIQLSFIPNYTPHSSIEDYETHTYIIVGEDCIMCDIWLPLRGSIDMSVIAQDFDHLDILGKKFFHGQCLSVDDACYTIRGDDGVEYQFLRIDSFSATDYLDKYGNQIDVLQQSRWEPKHIEIATEYAVDLWKSQLGLIGSIEWENLHVLYDPFDYYWLISFPYSESTSYFALMSENGDFVSVWAE